ncbi:PIH1 domain-containing protein 2 isoform X2 [Spea bombifrons]|uniref:PIH1 domain-containing protein 2 isoform X2 n=1 Tax=Spea bombifrons TaxID=233779 RepID=UPI00234A029D|nr:PIH1 domain-containing protein 2 isoform X2 [Spea bombifrons]
MEGISDQNELLSQVNQFWNMLDDMAENSPESYQRFIQKHVKGGKEIMAPPQPHMCLQTKILDPEEKVLFINICSWSRVPAPQSEAHPMPLSGGRLEILSEGAVTDIAYNPEVLKRADQDPVESDQLIRLAMKYIEEQHKVTLCHSYHLAPFKLKGNVQRMKDCLQGIRKQPDMMKKDVKKGKESLLEQIKNLTAKGAEEEHSPSICLTAEKTPKNTRSSLIEEISSTELKEEDLLMSPKFDLSDLKDESGRTTQLLLKVELPRVRSVAECELSVSEDDLMLTVPGKYKLHLNLHVPVNEDTVTAQYNKANCSLTVKMSAL